ncbi:kynurenine/alpha-aminoadipate aminotransferase, mitochondrial-like [Diadema antillarum]|uniref:kynurenine/alpha-aminoadipate aminotransferase, mitochondrial-like n=1 Tax=Diadema antillarum TaxID=105358 RepID=UPI003A8461B1
MNYSNFLSESGALQRLSPLLSYSVIGRETAIPLINLSTGLPNSNLFHLVGAKFQLRDGSTVELSSEDMDIAQNYGKSDGVKPFREWLEELTIRLHKPPTTASSDQDRALQVIVNIGASHGLYSTANLLLNKGQRCLIQERTYPTFLESLRLIQGDPIGIKMEEDGPSITHLEEVLSQWNPDDKENWSKRPKLFYIVPNGHNPSGETVSLEKRLKIYALAQRYDFIILEDDPYYFLQFDQPRLPSFLSMDSDGRVIRLDSFSKIIGAGFRLGWLSGPHALVSRLNYDIQANVQHANLLSQMVMHHMFRQWGLHGFLERADEIKEFYLRQRDALARAAADHLTGLAKWSAPRCGMFMWIELPTIKDTEKFLCEAVLSKGVLLTPGNIFHIDQSKSSSFIRVSYSRASESDLAEGMKRLGEAVRESSYTANLQ